ncbi:5225_t:CDS:2 [Rhizophagus irregularis]|nr:5225_t:CDS:2 [Rhizophagus irregularis]
MTPFKPSTESSHSATLIDNKLYILGGVDLNSKMLNEFFYLDVSVPFNTQELSWQDLSNINMVPIHHSAASVKGGPNNDTLFLYGGGTTGPIRQIMASVYTFDSQSIVWSIPKIAEVNTIRKWGLTGVIDYNGKVYLWGGKMTNEVFSNDMLILDTINPSWNKGSIVNAPIPRAYYGATLLPNNRIIYIGGYNDNTVSFYPKTAYIAKGTALTLSEVYIYDTINDNWNTKTTSGKIPSNRAGHSTILGLDGQRIIMFGGFYSYPGYLDTTLYVLDLNNYNWYIPKISGKIPKPRLYHKANVIGKYMVISFGQGYDKTVESDILLLDISKIAGAVVGTLLSGILLLVGSFLIYKWNKNKQKQKTIYENENDNDHSQEEKELPAIRDIHNYEQEINNNEQEIIQINQIPRNENTSNNEPIIIPPPIINKNNYHKQEIILSPENGNTTNHEPIIIPVNDYYHGQEIVRTFQNENTTSNHEPIIPEPAVVNTNNYNYGQEVISTPNNNNRISTQFLKDEIIQAIKQEIGQNLKNEILQAVREENLNNFNATKNK